MVVVSCNQFIILDTQDITKCCTLRWYTPDPGIKSPCLPREHTSGVWNNKRCGEPEDLYKSGETSFPALSNLFWSIISVEAFVTSSVSIMAKPQTFGIVLYPGFQLTDVCGPLDVLNLLSSHFPTVSISLIGRELDPVATVPTPWPSNMGMLPFTSSQTLTPTHTFASAPQLDVLVVPGGMGCFDPSPDAAGKPNMEVIDPIAEFVLKQYSGLKYLITVCTGSGIVSQTGLLDGKKATLFKGAWSVIPKWRKEVTWVPRARWVVDGNIWTSSGVCSGTDLMFGFVKEIYGEEVAKGIATWMEYQRHEDPEVDPFGIEPDEESSK